jgi:hypothetical protein
MGAPRILADDVGNPNLYTKVVLTDQSGTSTGVAGFEPWRAFRGSRSPFAYWAPGTPNTLAYLQLQHPDQPRGIDMGVLSYGHNLAGFPVTVLGSNDGSTFATLVSATIPTVTGGILSGANGVLTEMGDWMFALAQPVGYHYYRFNIPAMGAGLQPNVPCLQLGLSYQPLAFYRPYMEHRTKLASSMITSPAGYVGRGTRGLNRSGSYNLRADVTDYEYLQARLHIEELFGSGRKTWFIADQDRATEAFCAIRPDGEQGFERPTQLFWPTASIQVFEYEPLEMR